MAAGCFDLLQVEAMCAFNIASQDVVRSGSGLHTQQHGADMSGAEIGQAENKKSGVCVHHLQTPEVLITANSIRLRC